MRHQVPLVKAVMTPFPHSINASAPVDQARQMMGNHSIRHLPVIDGERLVGIVSDRDVRLAIDFKTGAVADPGITIGDICDRGVFVVELNERLDGVLKEMLRRRIDSAIVVRSGHLAGIFTTSDACRFLAQLLAEFFPGSDGHVA